MASTPYETFLASMQITWEKWHDGVGYALAALDALSAAERARIDAVLLAREPPDWRDLEALARLDTPAAQARLRAAMRHRDPAVRAAALRHGSHLVAEDERVRTICSGIAEATFFNGMSGVLEAAADCHPPVVVEALLRAALAREGEVAVHLAALLMFVHGKAAEPFDWAQRPFFLRFATPPGSQRGAAFRDLCAAIGRDPAPYLAR